MNREARTSFTAPVVSTEEEAGGAAARAGAVWLGGAADTGDEVVVEAVAGAAVIPLERAVVTSEARMRPLGPETSPCAVKADRSSPASLASLRAKGEATTRPPPPAPVAEEPPVVAGDDAAGSGVCVTGAEGAGTAAGAAAGGAAAGDPPPTSCRENVEKADTSEASSTVTIIG